MDKTISLTLDTIDSRSASNIWASLINANIRPENKAQLLDQCQENQVPPLSVPVLESTVNFCVKNMVDEQARHKLKWLSTLPGYLEINWESSLCDLKISEAKQDVLIDYMPDPHQIVLKKGYRSCTLFASLVQKDEWNLIQKIQQRKGVASIYYPESSKMDHAMTPFEAALNSHDVTQIKKIMDYEPDAPEYIKERSIIQAINFATLEPEMIQWASKEALMSARDFSRGGITVLEALLLLENKNQSMTPAFIFHRAAELLEEAPELLQAKSMSGLAPLGFIVELILEGESQPFYVNAIHWLVNKGATLDQLPLDWLERMEKINPKLKVTIEELFLKRELRAGSTLIKKENKARL